MRDTLVTSSLGADGHGIRLVQGNAILLDHVSSTNNSQNGIYLRNIAVGFSVNDHMNIRIVNSRFEVNTGFGIAVESYRHPIIVGNWVEGNGNHGIALLGDVTNGPVEDCEIIGNHILAGGSAGAGDHGLHADRASQCRIMGNYIDGFPALGGGSVNINLTANSSLNLVAWNHLATGRIVPTDAGTNNFQTIPLNNTVALMGYDSGGTPRVLIRKDSNDLTRIGIDNGAIEINTQYIQVSEISDPAAPVANGARLYAKDNGGGKTQLCVRFATGAVQCFATEP